MVGPGRLELPTSRLSGVRSNQLSYGPPSAPERPAETPAGLAIARTAPMCDPRREGKRNEDGGVPHLCRCLELQKDPKIY